MKFQFLNDTDESYPELEAELSQYSRDSGLHVMLGSVAENTFSAYTTAIRCKEVLMESIAQAMYPNRYLGANTPCGIDYFSTFGGWDTEKYPPHLLVFAGHPHQEKNLTTKNIVDGIDYTLRWEKKLMELHPELFSGEVTPTSVAGTTNLNMRSYLKKVCDYWNYSLKTNMGKSTKGVVLKLNPLWTSNPTYLSFFFMRLRAHCEYSSPTCNVKEIIGDDFYAAQIYTEMYPDSTPYTLFSSFFLNDSRYKRSKIVPGGAAKTESIYIKTNLSSIATHCYRDLVHNMKKFMYITCYGGASKLRNIAFRGYSDDS